MHRTLHCGCPPFPPACSGHARELEVSEAVQSAQYDLPIGPIVVPFRGSYLESYKVIPKKELLWSLWVIAAFDRQRGILFRTWGILPRVVRSDGWPGVLLTKQENLTVWALAGSLGLFCLLLGSFWWVSLGFLL